MLAYNQHWHFAKQHFRPWGESRFARFAKTGNNDDAINPDGQLEGPEGMEQTELLASLEQSNSAISKLTGRFRGRIETARPLVARSIVDAPFAFEQALQELENQEKGGTKHSEALQKLMRDARQYLLDADNGKDIALQKATLTEEIAQHLQDPTLAVAVSKALDERAETYDAAIKEIGDTPLSRIITLEKALYLDAKQERIDPNTLSEATVARLLQELQIDPSTEIAAKIVGYDERSQSDRESQRSLDALQRNLDEVRKPDGNFDASGSPTKEFKVRLIEKKIRAAKTLAIIEQKDFGTKTTIDNAHEVKEKLVQQVVEARRHLESTVQLRALELMQRWREYRVRLVARAGGEDTATIAQYLGESPMALDHRFMEIQSTLVRAARRGETIDGKEDAGNLKRIQDAGFTQDAATTLEKLDDLEWMISQDEQKMREGIGAMDSVEQKNATEWMKQNIARLESVNEQLHADPRKAQMLGRLMSKGSEVNPDIVMDWMEKIDMHVERGKRIAAGNANSEDLDHLREHLAPFQRNTLDVLLLSMTSSTVLRQSLRDRHLIEADTTKNSEEMREQALQSLKAIEERLFENGCGSAVKHPALKHDVCNVLLVREKLGELFQGTHQQLHVLTRMKGNASDAMLRQCRLTIAKLKKAADELDRLENEGARSRVRSIPANRIKEYKAAAGTESSLACYNRRDGVIYVNEYMITKAAAYGRQSVASLRNEAISHEKGHAIVDILMKRIGVLPAILVGLDKGLQQTIKGDAGKKTYAELLRSRATAWGVEQNRQAIFDHELKRIASQGMPKDPDQQRSLAVRETEDQLDELLKDELVNKYASWVHSGKPLVATSLFATQDITLFTLLDSKKIPPLQGVAFTKESLEEMPDPELVSSMTMADGRRNPFDDEEQTGNQGEANSLSAPLIGQKITEMQNKFLLLKEFVKNHSGVDGVGEFEAWVDQWNVHFEKNVKGPFYATSKVESERVPESQIYAQLQDMSSRFVEPAQKQMDKVIANEMEASQHASADAGIMGIIQSIEMISIMNVVHTMQQMGEDLTRMWKRRSERVESLIGSNLTGWIPDNNIWGLKYAGQLKHEFGRRSNNSELEEVKQWKEAYANVDSPALMEMVTKTRNKDEVRGIVELLIERGRLDMNDEGLWDTLINISGMPMPKSACKNNSVLRDKWLQRMVTVIWDDKEKFYEWRQANDSGIDSGKKKFTQVADQLSNLSGGMEGALERQLRMWVLAKKSGESVPDEVNPHLYEEILHYAMRNGKMTMEGKFFYLVQAARYGLLSIDRLQALAGQNGGVLNLFPFIDYFYKKNNTHPEIDAIGKRLEEGTADDERFKPGPNTTLWLHLEVLRNESARQRISKATSGSRAEGIDHEDIPTIMAQADYVTINRLTDIISGSREKLSPEAVRNSYTGFGTKFKILARLAELDREGKARFTEADALEAAKSIAAYVHMDNIFTRNGNNEPRRSTIDWAELEQGAPSIPSGLTVASYRTANNNFTKALVSKLNDQFDWGEMNTSLDDYIRDPGSRNNRADADQKKNFQATISFNRQIITLLKDKGNREILKDLLIKYAGEFREENYGDKISKDKLGSYLDTRRKHGTSALLTAA